jgi:hypothetical protein
VTHGTGEAAAAAAHNGRPVLALLVSALVAVGVLVPVALGLRAQWRARRELRHCPICNADAIREATCHEVNVLMVRVVMQCGQCGTWRRLTRTPAEQRSHDRRLKRDQRRIRSELVDLEAHAGVRRPGNARSPEAR